MCFIWENCSRYPPKLEIFLDNIVSEFEETDSSQTDEYTRTLSPREALINILVRQLSQAIFVEGCQSIWSDLCCRRSDIAVGEYLCSWQEKGKVSKGFMQHSRGAQNGKTASYEWFWLPISAKKKQYVPIRMWKYIFAESIDLSENIFLFCIKRMARN